MTYVSGDGNLDPFGSKYSHCFLDSLVSTCVQLLDKLQDHFFTVSHFVYEFVEFGIFLGHQQSSILSNKLLDQLDVTAAAGAWSLHTLLADNLYFFLSIVFPSKHLRKGMRILDFNDAL